MHNNIFFVIVLPFFMFKYYQAVLKTFFKKETKGIHFKPGYVWTFIACMIAFWILRNIPIAPFDLIAPLN
jgi:hypothetical protein